MSRGASVIERDSGVGPGTSSAAGDAGPLGLLPRLSHRQFRLEQRLNRWARDGSLPPALDWLRNDIGGSLAIDRPEILWRASGLGRAGLVAQMTAPSLATRLALGIEIPLAHTIVDRLLGFDRSLGESRLQLTPVEWGVWSFLFLRALDSFGPTVGRVSLESVNAASHLGPGALTLDRVGPDPFDPSGLGSIVTIRWPVRIGDIAGSARLWIPESVVSYWLAAPIRPVDDDSASGPRADAIDRRRPPSRFAAFRAASWQAPGAPRQGW